VTAARENGLRGEDDQDQGDDDTHQAASISSSFQTSIRYTVLASRRLSPNSSAPEAANRAGKTAPANK
jgi:hypothetical protein